MLKEILIEIENKKIIITMYNYILYNICYIM